ncbi:hypothetical protein GCM10010441_77000 [Kitasatospora paracochleata]
MVLLEAGEDVPLDVVVLAQRQIGRHAPSSVITFRDSQGHGMYPNFMIATGAPDTIRPRAAT